MEKEYTAPTSMDNPPLGLRPRWAHSEDRMRAIVEAVERYLTVGKAIPTEWLQELMDINEWYSKQVARK